MQIVNNTLFALAIRLNGREHAALIPGGMFYFSAREIYGSQGQQMTIQLVFSDRGRLIGTGDYSFYVPTQGVYAHQYLVGPSDIRR